MKDCRLLALPEELILEIAKYASLPSLSAWIRTCRYAFNILNPVLYSLPEDRIRIVLCWAGYQRQSHTMQRVLDHNWLKIQRMGSDYAALDSACVGGLTEIVRWLLEHGVSPNPPDSDSTSLDSGESTVLYTAAWRCHTSIVELLLAAGANPSLYDFDQVSSLVHYRGPSGLDTTRLLIQHGMDIHQRNMNGDSLLHYVCRIKDVEPVISLLLDHGMDINTRNNDGQTPLIAALAVEDDVVDSAETVDALLRRGAEINIRDTIEGWSALHCAVRYAKLKTVQKLIDAGADVHAQDLTGRTPLHIASQHNLRCDELVKPLLDAGACPAAEATRDRGPKWTPLHMAVLQQRPVMLRYLYDAWVERFPALQSPKLLLVAAAALGEVDMVQRLLDEDVNVDGKIMHNTALMAAAIRGHDEVIRLLLPRVKDMDARDIEGRTALHLAIIYATQSTVELLLPRSTYTATPAQHGGTLLTGVVWYQPVEVIEMVLEWRQRDAPEERWHFALQATQGNPEKIRLLLKHIPRDHLQPRNGFVPLIYVIENKCSDVAVSLIGQRITLEDKNTNGFSPLMAAAQKGDLEVVRALLNQKVDLEVQSNGNHVTALTLALVNDHDDVAKCLLAAGANPAVYTGSPNQESLLVFATRHQNMDIVRSLLDAGVDVDHCDEEFHRSPFAWAVESANFEFARFFLSRGAGVDKPDREGRTALSWAAFHGYEDIIPVLLEAGAAVDAVDRRGRSALSWAADRGRWKVVKLLVDAGATVNIHGLFGWTPWLIAVCNGHRETAEALMQHGADTRQKDYSGRAALSLCADQGLETMVDWLIQNGVDLDEGDRDGRTALSWAMQTDQVEVVKVLVAASCDVAKADRYGRTPLHWAGSDKVIGRLYPAIGI